MLFWYHLKKQLLLIRPAQKCCTLSHFNLPNEQPQALTDAARLQSSFRILVTRALLAKFSEWNSSKPRLMRTFRLVRRV
jgi:hypothetical protein